MCNPELIIFDLHNTLLPTSGGLGWFNVDLELYPDAENLIKYLYEKNIKLAVVSNTYQRFAKAELDAVAIEKYFDQIIGIDTYCNEFHCCLHKPSMLIGKNLIKDLQINGNCIWMIGDEEVDWKFAENNGFEFIGYDNEYAKANGYLNYNDYSKMLADIKNLQMSNNCIWMIGDHDYDMLFGVNNDFIAIGYNNEYAIENNYLNYSDYNSLLNDIKYNK